MRLAARRDLPNVSDERIIRSRFSQLFLRFFFQFKVNASFSNGGRYRLRLALALLNQSYDFIQRQW
jgi:hypothetical protein